MSISFIHLFIVLFNCFIRFNCINRFIRFNCFIRFYFYSFVCSNFFCLFNLALNIETCEEIGCSCDNFREELLNASKTMILAGKCINCNHVLSQHPRRSISMYIYLFILLFYSFFIHFKYIFDFLNC